MGIIPSEVVNMVLLVAFGVYCLMGLIFFITGIVYMGDAGTVGATGIYLMALGFIMLIVGGIAIWANNSSKWMILFVIELINIALFLFLYCLIVIVLLMASGTTDPVTDATEETWDITKPTLTIPGSDPDGDAVFTYCQTQGGVNCGGASGFYETAIKTATCQMAPGYSQKEVLDNCTILRDDPGQGMGSAGGNSGCAGYYDICVACDAGCKAAQIQDVKDNLEPASLFVLLMIGYLTITIVWNSVMLENEGLGGVPQMVGYVLNGVLLALSFFLFAMSAIGAWKASDACPKAADGCVPTSMTILVLIGFGTFVVAGIAVFGVHTENSLCVTIATIIMVFLAIFMVMFGLIIGMSTGVVMEDAEYYYDTNYPKLRSALEKADNSYCQMSKAQCVDMIKSGASQPVQTDDYKEAVLDEDDNAVMCAFANVWPHMYAEASIAALETDAVGAAKNPTWLDACATTGICIYCNNLFENTPSVEYYAYNNLATGNDAAGNAKVAGAACTPTGATDNQCVQKTPNFVWNQGLAGAVNSSGVWTAETAFFTVGQDTSYSTFNPKTTNAVPNSLTSASLYDSTLPDASVIKATSLRCMGEDATASLASDYDATKKDCNDCITGPDDNPHCYGVFTVDDDATLYNARCRNMDLAQMKRAASLTNNGNTADPCDDAVTRAGDVQLDVESSDSWTSKVANFTRSDVAAKKDLPYCEEAINEYVTDDRFCKDYGDQSVNQRLSWYANCDSCDNPLAPFAFGYAGPERGFRQCLNYFVGHYKDKCITTGTDAAGNAYTGKTSFEARSTLCKAAIRGGTGDTRVNFLVDKAYDDGSSFCGYDDESCKAKIKYDIQGSMTTIGVMGAVFLFFFLATIYCTFEAIKEYRGGDDDDDDDDSDE
jgi:hypothetical protein